MLNDHRLVWDRCLSVIRDNVPSISFKTWFEPIVPVNLDDEVLTIQVPSPFFYEYLEEQYIDLLRKTLRKNLGLEPSSNTLWLWGTTKAIHNHILSNTRQTTIAKFKTNR